MDKLEKYNEAIKYFSKSIELEPTNSKFWHNRGCIFRNLGKLDLALNDINKAISLDSSNELFYPNIYLKISFKNWLDKQPLSLEKIIRKI